jgi:hypothetical protein
MNAYPSDFGASCREEVRTVQEAGWAGVKNGARLRAADSQFDALLTLDQGVEHQQNSGRTQALVTLEAHDIRAVSDDDLLSVRSSHAIAS